MFVWTRELDDVAADVLGADHPISIGWRLKLITTSPYANKNARLSTDEMTRFLGGEQHEGMCLEVDDLRVCVIVINYAGSDAPAKRRIVELITHECSHALDGFFDRCFLVNIDTELRAYYLDYLVGKVCAFFPGIFD